MMIPRAAANTAKILARGFPIVALTGPRQSGKTTLARTLFSEHEYVSLEDPETRDFASRDPRRFLARYSNGAIIDETQRCPDLFSYLQGIVDKNQRKGEFILTGSQQFGLHSGISQSLAGRVGLINLLPLSIAELQNDQRLPQTLDQTLLQGGYPPIHDRNLEPALWFPNYVSTYLERDVRQMLEIRNLDQFQRFVKLCAARTGQILNLSSLANDCGISHVTAGQWMNVLEASYLVLRLRPYFRNFGKRLVKRPKLYFLDAGLAAWLMGIKDVTTLSTHAHRGALFETMIVSEFIKARYNEGQPADLYFWRDNVGHEIDLIQEQAGHLQAIEIKSGATFVREWLKPIKKWQDITKELSFTPRIIYGGTESYQRENAKVESWQNPTQFLNPLKPET